MELNAQATLALVTDLYAQLREVTAERDALLAVSPRERDQARRESVAREAA